jgi:hypothetical protein
MKMQPEITIVAPAFPGETSRSKMFVISGAYGGVGAD